MVETRVITVDPDRFDASVLAPASKLLREGGLVAIPTETVYGIAVNLEREASVRRLLEVRRSSSNKLITVHLGDPEAVRTIVPGTIPAAARRLMRKFWPGPLTLVFPTPDGEGVGVRVPNHAVAREILRGAGCRVGVPSANLSGQDPAVTGEEVLRAFRGEVDLVVDAGPARHRGASTVARIEGTRVEILREGAIPKVMIEEANVVTVLFVCTGNTCRSPMAEAIFRRMLADRLGVAEKELGARGWKILSAGTASGQGGAAAQEAESVVKDYKADLSDHVSRPVSVSMVEEADRVYVMTARHREVLVEWMPDHADKIELLDPSGKEIADPIGEPERIYRQCAEKIHKALRARIEEIA